MVWILLAAGGHGRVVASLASACGHAVDQVLDPRPDNARLIPGAAWLGPEDDLVLKFDPGAAQLLNGVGANSPARLRRRIFDRFSEAGYTFPALVHPSAWIAPDVDLGAGAQVMAGAIIQPGARIGANVIVNTGAQVDHDCRIGDHVHLAPGSTLCGAVTVGAGAMVGAGATVIPGLDIGEGAMVAAGATVCRDVAGGSTVRGTPAR